MGYKRTLAAGSALIIALSGCSGGSSDTAPPAPAGKPQTQKPVTEPPPESIAVKGGKDLRPSRRLRRPVEYDDAIKVTLAGVKQVKPPRKGVGEIAKKPLTVFALRFDNGSREPLDLNAVLVTVEVGKRRKEVAPSSYGKLNDFYGKLAPGQNRTASYVFALPKKGRKNLRLKVKFDEEHKPAIFRGALR